MKSLYWHDYETWGSNPRVDRPSQFAGIRTDEELNIIGDPLVMYCRPADDFLPAPGACVVTGITPQQAVAEGVPEAEFCRRILEEFSQPSTCVTGYNSIRFDDEVSRHMLYRCLHDPYEREWKNGNSRWDIIDMLRLAHAVRPDGIQWPKRPDGHTSFRLEELTEANGIGHEDAHDALSDVKATIAVAKLLKQAQPKLYDWCYRLRDKRQVLPLLDPDKRQPLLHVSGMLGAEKGNMAVVLPLARDPVNRNAVIVYDLSVDPASWLHLDAEAIRERLFTAQDDLPEGVERIPLKQVHANKCPALAPLSVLDEAAQARWQVDLKRCALHLEMLQHATGLEQKLSQVYQPLQRDDADHDPDFMLYGGGFMSDSDKREMTAIQHLLPEELVGSHFRFQDSRLPEMLFRLRARNYPQTLSAEEQQRWWEFRRQRLLQPPAGVLGWQDFWQALQASRQDFPEASVVLDDVAAYAGQLGKELQLES